MTKTPLTETELDALFGAARRETPVPSGDLVARIMAQADAEAEAGRPAPALPQPEPQRPSTLLHKLLDGLGGWGAVAGLASAALGGVVIGFASPDTLETWTGGYLSAALGYQIGDMVPSLGALLVEG